MNAVYEDLVLSRSLFVDKEWSWTSHSSDDNLWKDAVENGSAVPITNPPEIVIQISEVALRIKYLEPTVPTIELDARQLSRIQHSSLLETLQNMIHQQERDSFSLFQLLSEFLDVIRTILELPPNPNQNQMEEEQSFVVQTRTKILVFWSHHLLATGKRKNIVQWGRELDLWGISKPGYPGVIIVEGLEANVDEFKTRIKALNWKALQVRSEMVSSSFMKLPRVLSTTNDAPAVIHEVEGLGEVGELMNRADLQDLFLSVMKISK